MAQADRRAAAAVEVIGKDVFLKSFTQQSGNISATQLTALVSSVQNLNLSILKVGAATGRTIWQTYTIDETPIARGKNKRGNLVMGPSGATVWSAVTLDKKLNRLYAATSDNYSQPATGTSDSIVALSMSTGKTFKVA